MQRDPSLIPISHQHQHALALCVLVERALARNTSAQSARREAVQVLQLFDLEIRNHFQLEETLLFPAIERHMGEQPLVRRFIAEHREMERMAVGLRRAPSAESLLKFTALLCTHVRAEESELFEDIQKRLPRETLDMLGSEFDARAVRELPTKMPNSCAVLLESNLDGIERHGRGKVRDVYAVDGKLLIVATDRISAFDYILASGIPDKGRVLTQLSVFWFDFLRDLTPTHFLTANINEYPETLQRYSGQLEGRSMLVKRAKMIDIECVARGYLSGSGWKEYREFGTVCGIRLPAGMRESDKLPQPIFTPATKAQSGHDENISFERTAKLIGEDLAARLRDLTLAIYRRASDYAEGRGIIIADTKFEFGFAGGALVLGDEVLTPDSSRFWPAEGYRPGGPQPSYDKQYVRDYLEAIRWDKQPPAPGLPPEVIEGTSNKYREAYRLLTGREL